MSMQLSLYLGPYVSFAVADFQGGLPDAGRLCLAHHDRDHGVYYFIPNVQYPNQPDRKLYLEQDDEDTVIDVSKIAIDVENMDFDDAFRSDIAGLSYLFGDAVAIGWGLVKTYR